jgi:hypothetical protein
MNPSLEERIAELEHKALRTEACLVFQSQASDTLLALLEDCANAAKLDSSVPIPELYRKMLRERTEQFLATISDESPALVSQLRDALKIFLDQEGHSGNEH